MALEFVNSSKGKPKLCLDGYLYVKDKQCQNKIYWKCENFKKTFCKCRLTTVNNEVSKQIQQHNHAGDGAQIEANKILNKIREDARNTRDAPHYIVSSASMNISQAVSAKLSSVDTMKRTIRNIRTKHNDGPAIPSHRRNIVFPDNYTTTENGEQFLLFDSGPVEDRMIIFSTRRNLQLLARSDHWYADGTFKTVPPLFEQLYTIHGLRGHIALPLIYALLPSKSEQCYIQLLRTIKNLEPAANPNSIMTDFEHAMVNAINVEFPEAVHRGCFFHFCQCIYRNIQSNGLKREYDTDPDFALKLRMLSALAFVPRPHLEDYFDALCDLNILPPHAQTVIDYFEDTWIGRPDRRHRRRPPRFSHQMWNCYDNVQQGLPKTNNAIEGWHRGFQNQISAEHPNIWKFITAIKREQSLNELRIEQYISGQEPPAGSKKYKDCAERLARVVSTFEPNVDVADYLRGVAHNISY